MWKYTQRGKYAHLIEAPPQAWAPLGESYSHGQLYLIFVTGTTGSACGEKICHVEKVLHMADCHVEKFLHVVNVEKICHVKRFLHMRNVETNLFCHNLRYFIAKLCLCRKNDKYQVCGQHYCPHTKMLQLQPSFRIVGNKYSLPL